LAVKSPSEFIELSTAHAPKQFEAMTAQTKELTDGDAILAPPDRVFDDTWATFRISGDGFDNCPFAIGTKVKMRLLHNFHIRDGMIAKEIGYEVWRRDE
jgi:hypothetical protein